MKPNFNKIQRDINATSVISNDLLVAPNSDTTPTKGIIGAIAFNTADNSFIGHGNTGWAPIGGTQDPVFGFTVGYDSGINIPTIIGSYAPVIFNVDSSQPYFNNTNYDVNTGLFIAPQTGLYQFNVHFVFTTPLDINPQYINFVFMKNGIIEINFTTFTYTNEIKTIIYTDSLFIQLNAGENIGVYSAVPALAVTPYTNTFPQIFSTFSGFLIK